MKRKIKVLKSHPVITNVILFILACFLFLAIQLSLQSHISFLNIDFLKNFFFREWMIFLIGFGLFLLVNVYSPVSILVYRLFIVAVCFRSLQGLFIDFNKLILLLLFSLTTIAYLFDQLLRGVFSKSFYESQYSENSIFEPRDFLPAVEIRNESQELFKGKMTNWDEEGFFARGLSERLIGAEDVKIDLKFMGKIFPFQGAIVSLSDDLKGCGIIVVDTDNKVKWEQFIDLLSDLGLDPALTR